MIIGIPQETCPGERRVALIPDHLSLLKKNGHEVIVQAGAGVEAGFVDEHYRKAGATVINDRAEVFQKADAIFQLRGLGSNEEAGRADLELFKPGQVLAAMLDPLGNPQAIEKLAAKKITAFSMELIPRITRAQSMDVLSSMATVAGYKAVLLAADHAPRMFPMFMTAAGTITPAHVFIIGAGVAGLQAIATAKRLGAVVKAYDVRSAVKEQIESLGAKFVEMDLGAGDAEDKGGYAKEMGDEFIRKQRELMDEVCAESDVVITTAAIPGKASPVLVTKEMVKHMKPGSVIVDLAAERGGNCEYTQAEQVVTEHGVQIHGPTNLPGTVPFHASQMYGKNLTTFLKEISKDGALALDLENEVHRETLVAHDGKVVHERIKSLLGN
ncbi:MAG: Re/Si-specific NAD(P)(+) transhydrogenase subunit alpha [Phycisphaerae bacterium]